MSIRCSCPKCQTAYQFNDDQAAQKVRCNKCLEVFTVGAGPSPSPAAAALRLACPKCQAVYQFSRDQAGQKVRCSRCMTIFAVGIASPPTPSQPPVPAVEQKIQPQPAPVVPPPLLAGNVPEHADLQLEVEPAHAPKWASLLRLRGRDWRSLPRRWLLGGAAAAVLFLVGGISLAVWLSGGKSSSPTPSNPDNSLQAAASTPEPTLVKTVVNKPKEPSPSEPPPDKEPLPAGGGQLTREVLTKVKRATAYLRVTLPDGSVAQGSGFFGAEPGIVLTNAHVLGMLEPQSRRPRGIDVVLDSGEPEEKHFPGELLDLDRNSDLAVLRVNVPNAPAPLEVRPAADLQETQEVYVFGFPFGDQLGKNITVSKSSVSSLRKAPDGRLTKVQVNGGMHPGNSGGPVVTARGDVIGVAVSVVTATQINFAVPSEHVRTILNGRLLTFSRGQPYVKDAAVKDGGMMVPIVVELIDPLRRVRGVDLEAWTGDAGKPRPPSLKPPAAEPGDSPRQRFKIDYGQPGAGTDVLLPPLPTGKVYWLQPHYVDGAGGEHWVAAMSYKNAYPPVDRRPVLLALQHQVGVRALALDSKATWKIRTDLGEEHSLVTGMETKLTENTRSVDERGTASVRLTYNFFGTSFRLDNEPVPGKEALRKVLNDLRFLAANLGVDRQGNLVRNDVDLSRVPAATREGVDRMHDQIRGSLEAVAVPVPNKQVAAQETWRAQRTLPIDTPGTFETGVLEMTYRYLGCHDRGVGLGEEACVGLDGVVRGKPGQELKVGGRATGTAWVSLTTGQVSRAQVSVFLDMDMLLQPGLPTVKASGTLEVTLRREPPGPNSPASVPPGK